MLHTCKHTPYFPLEGKDWESNVLFRIRQYQMYGLNKITVTSGYTLT